MSNTDIISGSSFDSGSDISKDPMKTGAYTPYEKIESQLLDLPDDWRPPSHPFARFCFTQLCLVTLGKPDLEELWLDVSHEAGWYKVMGDWWKELHHEGCWCQHVMQFQILKRACIYFMDLETLHRICTFRPVVVYWLCISRIEASISTVDHSSKETYGDLMLLSSYLLIPILFCRVFFALIAMQMEMQEIWAHKPRKMKILITLALSRMSDICLALSWACLASCGLGLFLEVNSVNYWMFLAGACTFAPFLDAVFKRNVRAMIWRGGLALILWFGVTLGYLQQIWELDC